MNEIASRYASALYSLALDNDSILSWQNEVKELGNILKDNPKFFTMLCSGFLSNEEKEELIDKTLVNITADIRNLIKVLIRHHRISLLFDVFKEFNSLANDYRGVKEGLVYSVSKLDQNTLSKLTKKISELEGCNIELTNLIEPNLIGGIKVVVNTHIYDGSIANKLEGLRKQLL